MSKHTPGPWVAVSNRTHPDHFGELPDGIVTEWQVLTGKTIEDEGWAVLHAQCEKGSIQPKDEDLRLIAAAPDLLAACQLGFHALAEWVEIAEEHDKLESDQQALDAMDAAIAKTEEKVRDVTDPG